MVCISCIVIPVFIWIWYRFIQPLVVYLWPKYAIKAKTDDKSNESSTELKCPFSKTNVETQATGEAKKDL
jgi:hypothetical protein